MRKCSTKSTDWCLTRRRRRFDHRDTEETQGRRLCDDGGGNWSNAATGQGMQRIIGNHLQLGNKS